MPTITQLPTSSTTTAADIIPVSQNGSTCAVSLGTLLAGTQPAIEIDGSSLLGRTSVGPGSPEQVDIGPGLSLTGSTLVATGADHAQFPLQSSFQATDNVVLSGSTGPSLLPVVALRGLFRPGAGVTITASGLISANAGSSGASGTDIAQLDSIDTVAYSDLIAVSHAGTTYSTSVSGLLNGTTVGQIGAAIAPSDTDAFLVAQGSEVLVRQNLGTVAAWLSQRIRGSAPDTIIISSNIILDPILHNNRVLICTAAVTISAPSTITSNFRSEAINVSGGDVTLVSQIRTSSGAQVLPSGQAMRLFGLQYSGTSIVFAWISGVAAGSGSTSAPDQPVLTSVNATSATSATLTWTGPSSAAQLSYIVNYRQSGTVAWTTANASAGTMQYTVSNLVAGVSYDFGVAAALGSAVGSMSNLVTVVMPATAPTPVSAPLALNATSVTTTAAVLRWTAPTSGQAQSYTVEYRPAGTNAWSSVVTNGSVLTTNLSGLLSGQSYEWRVTAVGTSGNSVVSTSASFTTSSAAPSVTAISWNIVPAGPFSKGVGAIGVNAHVTPATAPVQYGMSTSPTVQPSTWSAATYVNSDLWGAYLSTPGAAGSYYVWAQGMDGSATIVSSQIVSVT